MFIPYFDVENIQKLLQKHYYENNTYILHRVLNTY